MVAPHLLVFISGTFYFGSQTFHLCLNFNVSLTNRCWLKLEMLKSEIVDI